MPIYEFECQKCKDRVEVFQKINDKHPVKCKKCGGRLEKQVSASAIQFKGSGWYVTDYAGKSRKAAEKADREPAIPEKSDKSDKKTKESSPAKKTSEKASKTKLSSGD
jgi:putative FmdB family regulatory protein